MRLSGYLSASLTRLPLLFALVLISCADTPATSTPRPLRSSFPTAPAALTPSGCGEITVTGTPPRFSASSTAQQSVTCFLHAVESCAPETLTIRESNTGYIRQFTLQPAADGCLIRQVLQTDANAPPATADCASARAEQGGLLISSCSHLGDFLLLPSN